MRLFHYTTWKGEEARDSGVLAPSEIYLKEGPPLVWLTENEYWEPCVQAINLAGDYTREPSTPERYTALSIPCWKFEVEVTTFHKLHYPIPGWLYMLEDGKELGSDLAEWHWSTEPSKIIKVYRWLANKWEEQ